MADSDTDSPSANVPAASPPSSGGLMGFVGGLLKNSDPDFLMSIGAGLMSGAKYGSNAGEGLMQGLSMYQQQKQGQMQQKLGQQQYNLNDLNMQMQRARLPALNSYFQRLSSMMGGQRGAPSAAGSAPSGLLSMPPSSTGGLMSGGPAPSASAATPNAGGSGATGAPAASAPPPQSSPSTPSGGPDPFGIMQMGAFGAAVGAPGASEMLDYGKALAQYDPKTATSLESAKSAVAVTRAQIRDAQASGNTPLAQALNQKLRQDLGLLHIASMSGTQTRIGLNGDISTFNPNEGVQTVGGVESAIPGAVDARRQLAAGESIGKAAGETGEYTDPNTGTKYTVPKSVLLALGGAGLGNGGPTRAGRPQPGSPPPFPVASLGPGIQGMLTGNAQSAVEANKEYQSQAEAAQQMLAQTTELRGAASDFTPSAFAGTRQKFLEYLNASGLTTDAQNKSLAAAQAGTKIAVQLQAAATKQLGSREAAQVFTSMGKSMPNLSMSPEGLNQVTAYMDGMARYNIARAQVAQQRAGQSDANGVNSVRNDFISNTNPSYFIIASAPPATQRQILDAMDSRKSAFLQSWNAAANNGWAPRPNAYWSQ